MRKRGTESIFKAIVSTSWTWGEKWTSRSIKAKRTPNRLKLNRAIIKFSRVKKKERFLKAAGGKRYVIYQGIPLLRLSAGF